MAGRNLDITAKLSKKIAELTVVVHMLFKRNHEKEVEYDFFKLLSERERTNLMKENDAKVAWLEKQLEEQEAYRAKVEYQLKDLNELREKVSTLQATKSELEEHLSRKDEDLRISGIKIEGLKQQIEEYARELQGLKKGKYDENDREIITDEIVSVVDDKNDTKKLEEEISELKIKHKDEITKLYAEKVLLQNKVGSFNSAFSQEIDELKQMLDALSKRQVEDQQKIYDSEVKKNNLAQSLKKSEEDKKSLQKKMQFLKEQLRLVVRNKPNQKGTLSEETQPQRTSRNIFETRDEELERLRHEVNLYRMELQNREGNFNRMFADQQPVVLKTQADSHLVERNLTGTRASRRHHLPRLNEGRSMTFMNGIKRTTFL